MKNFITILINISIDIILQGSLISYYFMNNHNFILENIIKFIPMFLFLIILVHIVALIGVVGARAVLNDELLSLNLNKEDAKKCLEELTRKKPILIKFWDIFTDISFGLLIILTGHPICFLMFIIIKCIYNTSKYIARKD